MGYNLDVDFIMVNQFMFTFRRNTGFLHNNLTSEPWIWKDHQYSDTLLHPKYDFDDNYAIFACVLIFRKVVLLASAIFGFMLLSFVNGLVVRIALACSNCFIFPLIAITRFCSNEELNDND